MKYSLFPLEGQWMEIVGCILFQCMELVLTLKDFDI